jgi:hypothetical protein
MGEKNFSTLGLIALSTLARHRSSAIVPLRFSALRNSPMNDQNDSQNWGDEMDRDEHKATYDAFINYSKWGSVLVIAILLFLLVFVYD